MRQKKAHREIRSVLLHYKLFYHFGELLFGDYCYSEVSRFLEFGACRLARQDIGRFF